MNHPRHLRQVIETAMRTAEFSMAIDPNVYLPAGSAAAHICTIRTQPTADEFVRNLESQYVGTGATTEAAFLRALATFHESTDRHRLDAIRRERARLEKERDERQALILSLQAKQADAKRRLDTLKQQEYTTTGE